MLLDNDAALPLARLPLGDALQPAVPDGAQVRALAKTPGIRTLGAVPRRASYVAQLEGPPEWAAADGTRPMTDDTATMPFSVPEDGNWPRVGAGEHQLRLAYSRGRFLRAGRGTSAAQPPRGPIAVTAPDDDGELPVVEVPPKRARSLRDGRSFDWIEALA